VHRGLPSVRDAMRAEMSLARNAGDPAGRATGGARDRAALAVVAGNAAASGYEVALAKLLGQRTASVLTQGLAPPVLLVLVAAPIAAAIVWGIVRAVAPGLLGAEVGVAFAAVARVLADEPDVLVAEEPTAELDSENRDRVVALLTAGARAARPW
jgi:hypothetical protein